MHVITGILVPVDEKEPLQRVEFDATDIGTIQGHVGGNVQVIDVNRPASSLWIHEEGKLIGLPINRRASLLLWLHAPAFRGQDILAGPVLVTGVADAAGDTTSVPGDLTALLLGTSKYRVEVQADSTGKWYGNEVRFDDWVGAYAYALNLAHRWTSVRDVRVVSADPAPLVGA